MYAYVCLDLEEFSSKAYILITGTYRTFANVLGKVIYCSARKPVS